MIRKTAFALSLGAIAAAAPLGAQIGLIGGFVSASLTEDPVTQSVTYSGKTGFAAGLSLKAGVANGVSIGPEVLYVQKGTNATFGVGSATTYAGWVKAAYVEVPVLLRIAFGSSGTRFFVTGGGQYSYQLSCTAAVPALVGGVVVTNPDACDKVFTAPAGLKTSDYGAVFGAGVSMGKISFSGRYELGLANVNKDETSTAHKVKNKAIMALITIKP